MLDLAGVGPRCGCVARDDAARRHAAGRPRRPPVRRSPAPPLAAVLLGLVILVAGGGAGGRATRRSSRSTRPTAPASTRAPPSCALTFSERVSADLGGVRVLDATATGRRRARRGSTARWSRSIWAPTCPTGPTSSATGSSRPTATRCAAAPCSAVGESTSTPVHSGGSPAASDDRVWEVVGAVGRGLRLRRRRCSRPAASPSSCSSTGAAPSGRRWSAGADRRAGRRGGSLVALPVQAALGTGQGPASLFDDGVARGGGRDGVGLGLVLALGRCCASPAALLRRAPALRSS